MNNTEEIELLNIFKPDTIHPYYYSLNRIKPEDWFLFGSLTWKDESRRNYDSYKGSKYREDDFNRLLNVFCMHFKLRAKNIAYYRATEYGMAGEAHFHFLIAKTHLEHLAPAICAHKLDTLWTKDLIPFDSILPGIGTADVRAYDPTLEYRAVKYCLKKEFDQCGQPRERYDCISNSLKQLILFKEPPKPSDEKICYLRNRVDEHLSKFKYQSPLQPENKHKVDELSF